MSFPIGKLPPDHLRTLLASLTMGEDVLIGPAVGRDVAVVVTGGVRLALKSDPVTLAAARIGWYAVHVNANDLATVGAEPRWFLATLLLPEKKSDAMLTQSIMNDMNEAAAEIGVTIVGGHTEVTGGLLRPIVAGTMIGVVEDEPIRPDGLREGDEVLLTKGMGIEATAIIAREVSDRLRAAGMSPGWIDCGANYLERPGISVLQDAQVARSACEPGGLHAMHDPTEGGVVTALDELADAAGLGIEVDPEALARAITPLTEEVCRAVGVDPRGAISSGALLIGVDSSNVESVQSAMRRAGIAAYRIGRAVKGHRGCRFAGSGMAAWPRFPRDEIARLFES